MNEFDKSQNRLYQRNMMNLQRGQNRQLKELAESAKQQAEAAEKQAEAAKRQAEIAEAEAERAKAEAVEAKRDAKFAKIMSVVAIISPIIWDLLKTYLPTILQLF